MAVLAGMVKNVLVIIIIASFLELMLPEGKVKPFVRFAIGLFIVISVLSPLLNGLFEEKSFEVNLWDYQVSVEQEREVLERGSRINEQIGQSGAGGIAGKIEGQVSAVALLVPGVKGVETEAVMDSAGTLEKLILTVTAEQEGEEREEGDEEGKTFFGEQVAPAAQKEIEEKIKGVINNLYSFSDVAIEVKFEGG